MKSAQDGKDIQFAGSAGAKLAINKDGTYVWTNPSGKKSEGKWKLVKDSLILTRKDPPKGYEPTVLKVAKGGKSFSMPIKLNFGGNARIAGSTQETKSMDVVMVFVREK
jgi:hypothetical protein